MKKKFYVCPQLAFVDIMLSIVGMVVMILCVTIPTIIGSQEVINIIIAFSVIIPSMIILMTICIMLAQITIDEKGVTKYLFGKKIKFFSWESIREIKGLNNDAYWIVFCNKLVPDEKLWFSNRKSYTIPIYKRNEVIDIIKQYCPNLSLIEKI